MILRWVIAIWVALCWAIAMFFERHASWTWVQALALSTAIFSQALYVIIMAFALFDAWVKR